MSRTLATGIDVGTDSVKVIVAEYNRGEYGGTRRVAGVGSADSLGLRHGYIVETVHVTRSIRQAVTQAERTARAHVQNCVLSVGGVGVEGFVSVGSSVVSRADAEITELDINRALAASQDALPEAAKNNRKIIHAIPVTYKLDGKEVIGGRVLGMRGVKLEIKVLHVTVLEQHLSDLIEAVERCGISIDDIVASPLASAVATLSKAQRIAGCILVDIGAETTSIIVYENDLPVSLKVFPIGSNDITNDIALGLRVPIEEAEKIKIGAVHTIHPKKKIDDIITARLKDVFELIETHLKKMGRNGLLPAGITLTGGGSRIAGIEDIAKSALALPSRIGKIEINRTAHGEVYDPSWAVAYGLALLGLSGTGGGVQITHGGKGSALFKTFGSKIRDLLSRFLP